MEILHQVVGLLLLEERLNTASNNYAFVGAGFCNKAEGYSSTISGGYKNCVNGNDGFIGGGVCNILYCATATTCTAGSTISGGVGNNTSGGTWSANGYFTAAPTTLYAAGLLSTIGGGAQNRGTGNISTIGGGKTNIASGCASTIAGGDSNVASNTRTTVGGGVSNTASGYASTISGGQSNTASNNYTVVSGGLSNAATGYINCWRWKKQYCFSR